MHDWFHLTQEAYSTKYGFTADGDLEAEDLINFDALAAALDAFLATLPDTGTYTADDPPIRVN